MHILGKVWGSTLSLNHVIANDVKVAMSDHDNINSTSRGNSLPCKVKLNQRVGCLLCSVVTIYKGDGS